jgi:hypothetical protein
MRITRFPALALILAAGLLAGCGKSKQVVSPLASGSGATPSNDQALIASAMAAAPQAIEDGLSDAAFETTLGGGPSGLMTAIQPLNFWRAIREQDRTLEFEFSDNDENGKPTTAIVTIRKRLVGQFNILVGPPAGDLPPPTAVRNVIHKPLEDHWVRRVLLKRVRLAGETGEPVWRIAGISGVKVTSKDATTNILSLRIQSAPLDTTIDDPLAFQRLRRVLRLQPGSPVTLTVTTGRNDDVVVFYHHDRRFRFHNNGDNTYTAVWPILTPTAGMLPPPGLQHFGVNAFSNGTLFDDQAPYDSQAWAFPYSLVPENLMAEFLP